MASTYSTSSFTGLVSSNRRLHFPPYFSASPEIQADGLGMPDVQVAVWFRGKTSMHPAIVLSICKILIDKYLDKIFCLFYIVQLDLSSLISNCLGSTKLKYLRIVRGNL